MARLDAGDGVGASAIAEHVAQLHDDDGARRPDTDALAKTKQEGRALLHEEIGIGERYDAVSGTAPKDRDRDDD